MKTLALRFCFALFAITAVGQNNAPQANNDKPDKTEQSCTKFTVVTEDKLGNIKQGLDADGIKWIQKTLKKYPSVCYTDPGPSVPLVLWIAVSPDTYHGTKVVHHTSTEPVSGTVYDSSTGSTSTVTGTTTTTSSTTVPYSFEYGIYTLSVQRKKQDGSFETAHRFQQKGIYNTLYGIPLGGRGHHPAHAVIEDAMKWMQAGGLADQTQTLAAKPN